MNKVNQLKAGVILSYLSIGISSVIQLAYTPVMLRLLGQSEYGLYSLVSSAVSYLGLLTFGIGGAYLRFYTREKVNENKDGVARLNGMFLLVLSAIGAVAMAAGLALSCYPYLLGGKLTAAEMGKARLMLRLLAVNLGISIPMGLFSSYIAAHEQYIFQRVLNIASSILNPFLALPLMLMGIGSLSLTIASLLITTATALCNICYCARRLHIRFSFRKLRWGLLKEIYIFSFFLFLNQIIDQVNWGVDNILLGWFWGTAEVAVYGLASRINGLYLGFSTAVSSVFAPRINRIAAEPEHADERLNALMIRVGRIQGLILLLLLLGLAMLGRPFLLWMGGDEAYLRSYPVMLLLLVPVTVPLVQNLGLEIQRAKNKHQFRALIYTAMAAGNVAVSIPLSARFGAAGAAAGTALSLIIGNGFLMNWYYHRHLGLDMRAFWCSILKLARGAVLPALYCICCSLMVDLFTPMPFLLAGLGLVVVYSLSMWRWGMNEDEKNLVRQPLANLRRRRGPGI